MVVGTYTVRTVHTVHRQETEIFEIPSPAPPPLMHCETLILSFYYCEVSERFSLGLQIQIESCVILYDRATKFTVSFMIFVPIVFFIFVHRMPRSNTLIRQRQSLESSTSTLCNRRKKAKADEPISKISNSSSRIAETATTCMTTEINSCLKDDSYNQSSSSNDILWDFATHTDASFHDISPFMASEMKSRLLAWYREKRRRLPWRGDPLHLFDETSSSSNQIIPITGYSVWVSEVMLQQTRVETVIPYYLRCTSTYPFLYETNSYAFF